MDSIAYDQPMHQTRPIEQGFADVEAALDRLEHHLSSLHGRLQPIVSPEGPGLAQVAGSLTQVTPERSEHATHLTSLGARVNAAADSIGSLIDRLEL